MTDFSRHYLEAGELRNQVNGAYAENADNQLVSSISEREHPASSSFLHELQETVNEKGPAPFATWYNESGQSTKEYTFQDLWEEAGVVAYYLREKWGIKKGERVVLCYNFGLHFFAAFLGCLRAGVTAVLVYPPGRPLVKSLAKMGKVVSDCTPALILTDSDVMLLRNTDRVNFMAKSKYMWPSEVEFKVTDKLTKFQAATTNDSIFSFMQRKGDNSNEKLAYDEPNVQPNDIAFLQYTSGSTGDPKGVMVTFSALQANVRLIRNGFIQCYSDDGLDPSQLVGFSWLPQYHDLGLIYCTITPFASGWRMHMMSPITFIKKPLLWLELMSRLRVSWSAAPDFAYNLVVRKFLEAKKKPSLDFSAIQHLQNSAEPVRLDTSTKFYQTFSKYGLRKNWMLPGYGLAENVVGVCWIHSYILSSTDEGCDTKSRVAVGKRENFDSSICLKIVSRDEPKELQDGEIGEIWISGPSVAAGYYGKTEISEEVFRAKLSGDNNCYLRTGDLGFFEKNHLYICGRMKDLIIVNGANYYPQDIEKAVQDALPSVRPGCVAAFSRDDTGEDGIVEIVFEIRNANVKDAEEICRSARAAVADATGLQLRRVAAITEKTIPKTTSGKIRRRATREALHAGKLHFVRDLEFSDDVCLTQKSIVRRLSLDRSLRSMGSTKSNRRGSIRSSLEEHSTRRNSIDISDRFDEEYNIQKEGTNAVNIIQSKSGKNIGNDSKDSQHDTEDDFSKIVRRSLGVKLLTNKQDTSWNEMGLTSITSAELQNELSTHFSVELGVDCFDQYHTPSLLKQHLLTSQNKPFPTCTTNLERTSKTQLSWLQMSILQMLGVAILIFMFALPIIPAYYVGKVVSQNHFFTTFDVNGNMIQWYWFPCVVPTWMAGLTTLVIVSKWAVVGKYQEQEILVQSLPYLRWWFVDRAVHLWEFWVGRFFVDTLLLWSIYRLMGAKIDTSAELKTFIREFDLVHVGPESSIKYPICCRRFGTWEEDEGPTLRFRKVSVGSNTTIKGMLSPGSNIENNASVERLSVVDEGAQVPSGIRALGNPAFNGGNISEPHNRCPWWKYLEGLKLAWLLVELYIFFTAFLASQIIWNGHLPTTFRYTPLLYGVLLIASSSVMLLAFSVPLKWLLIGRRKPGPFTDSLLRSFTEWATDYHFSIAADLLFPFSENSRLWNIVFKLFGMQIDLFSKLFPETISPSGVDLVRLEKAFTSIFSFDTESNGSYKQVAIVNSSIGYLSHIDVGATVEGKKIPPLSRVGGSIKGDQIQDTSGPWTELLYHEITLIFFYTLWFISFVASLVPSFEMFNLFAFKNSYGATFVLPLSLLVQTTVWVVTLFILQLLTFFQSTQRNEPWNHPLYLVYHTANCYIHQYSFLPLLWGSPLFAYILRFLGAKVDGQVIYLGRSNYECPYLRFEDKTIVDSSNVSGHFGLLDKVTLGVCNVGGLLHGGCFFMANASPPSSRVSGPLQATGSPQKIPKDDLV